MESENKKRFSLERFKKLDSTKQLILTFVILLSIPITVYLVRSFVLYLSKAAGTASIYFNPSTVTLPPDSDLSLMLDSGSEQVSFIKIEFTFDNTKVNLVDTGTQDDFVDPHPSFDIFRCAHEGCATFPEPEGTLTISEANERGKAVIVLGLDTSQTAPSGTFEVASFGVTPVTPENTTNSLSFNVSNMQVVELTQAENFTLSTTDGNVEIAYESPTEPPPPTSTSIPTGTGDLQAPFLGSAFQIPTDRIEVEDYDLGGEDVAYSDSELTNLGDSNYRSGDGVDVFQDSNASEGLFIGYAVPGEWLEYTVDVAEAGAYTLEARVAHDTGGGQFHLELDGQAVSQTINVPDTGGWYQWQTIQQPVDLSSGRHVLRLVMDGGEYIGNLDYLQFSTGTSTTPIPTATSAPTADTRMQMIANQTNPVGRDIPVNIEIWAGSSELVGVELDISFDPNRLTAVDIVPAGYFSDPDTTNKVIDNDNGRVRLTILVPPGSSPQTGNGTLATVTFTGNQVGSTRVDFTSDTLVAASGQDGNVLDSAAGITLDIISNIPGDINQDGRVNLEDYIILFENFGLSTSQASDPRADINGDGVINLLDYVILFDNFGRTA